MRATTDADVVAAARTVVAAGGDPARLGRVVAWCLRDGRSADGLRRRVLDRLAQPTVTDQPDDGPRPGSGHGPARGPGAGGDVSGAQRAEVVAFDAVLPPVPASAVAATVTTLRRWRELDVTVATVAEAAYPDRLRAGWPDRDAPAFVAWRGQAPSHTPAVAIVGARRATGYGTGVAAWLASAAAAAGVRVVSGGAVGIDAAAHLAALDGPGGTTVVLGCGHGVRYPQVHAGPGGLFDRLLTAGGTTLCEHLPHASANAGHVRARNRLVARLVDAVVVVEGGARSGALLTATQAADAGVPVLAVPGDVRAPGSVAPHRLLAEGAAPCTGPADLLDVLTGLGTAPAPWRGPPGPESVASVLPDDVRALLAAAWPRPLAVDDLAAATGRPVAVLLGALTRAQLAGETAEDTAGVRLRRAPA